MPSRKTIKNVIFLGLFALGVFLVAKNISLPANFLGLFIAGVASIRFI